MSEQFCPVEHSVLQAGMGRAVPRAFSGLSVSDQYPTVLQLRNHALRIKQNKAIIPRVDFLVNGRFRKATE
jgi:hypothetical protein